MPILEFFSARSPREVGSMDRTFLSPRRRRLCLFATILCVLQPMAVEAMVAASVDEQRAWIAAHPVVRYGSDTGWRPIIDVEDGRAVGLIPRYLALLSAQTGLRFEYVPTASAMDALARFQQGEL